MANYNVDVDSDRLFGYIAQKKRSADKDNQMSNDDTEIVVVTKKQKWGILSQIICLVVVMIVIFGLYSAFCSSKNYKPSYDTEFEVLTPVIGSNVRAVFSRNC